MSNDSKHIAIWQRDKNNRFTAIEHALKIRLEASVAKAFPDVKKTVEIESLDSIEPYASIWLVVRWVEKEDLKPPNDGKLSQFNNLLAFHQKLVESDKFISSGLSGIPVLYVGNFRIPENLSESSEQDLHFLDSSIWHRYVQVTASPISTFGRLKTVIEELRGYYDEGRYELNVAKEYLEHSLRRFQHYRLASHKSGGHWNHLTLHGFQSETLSDIGIDDRKKEIESYRWRVLLVDDHADGGMKRGGETDGASKRGFVRDAMAKLNDKGTLETETATNIQTFLKRINLGPNFYDIILLDYLLGDSENGRDTGIDLIHQCQDIPIKDLHAETRGHSNKFWFFPVSAFSGAFMARMATGEVLNLSNDYILADGADPVVTPKLFAKKLMSFIDEQKKIVMESVGKIDGKFFHQKLFELNPGRNDQQNEIEELWKFLSKYRENLRSFLQLIGKSSLVDSIIDAAIEEDTAIEEDKENQSSQSKNSAIQPENALLRNLSDALFDKIYYHLESYLRLLHYHRHGKKSELLFHLKNIKDISTQDGAKKIANWAESQMNQLSERVSQ